VNAGAKTLESALSTPARSAAVVAHCIQHSGAEAITGDRSTWCNSTTTTNNSSNNGNDNNSDSHNSSSNNNDSMPEYR